MITQPKSTVHEDGSCSSEQHRMPYFQALLEYVDGGVIPFHCPGHQQGRGTPEVFRRFVKDNGLAADITQVLGLDDIHQPYSVCKEAQELAAKAYGADATFFLINGSSSGNHAMVLSVLNPGDELILPRNVHRSTTGAMILSGAVPVYVEPEYDQEMQVDHTVKPEVIEQALKENPHARAVLIVSPTYYGAAADLKRITDMVHSYDKILMVDEAWGPHLPFHPDLPISAMEAGADICVNSTHKLISGMSQASMLHVKGNRIDVGRVHSVLRLFLSTSPSCLIVASLDVARMQMATEGKKLLDNTIRLAEELRDGINALPGMRSYGKELIGRPGVFDYDVTRVVFTARDLGYTGYEMEKILRYNYNIQVELSDLFNCIALITIGHTEKEVQRLLEALKDISSERKVSTEIQRLNLNHRARERPFELPDWPPRRMSPRDAFVAGYRVIQFEQSKSEICAEMITPYPPGIPVLRPGEEITQQIIDYLLVELSAGARIQGPVDSSLKTIRVVDQNHISKDPSTGRGCT